MDRFEALSGFPVFDSSKIYIPVWIDLKFVVNSIFFVSLFYLHSSMDRFEEKSECFFIINQRNLHSSMDRFEASDFELSSAVSVIYIPVWIDLKSERFDTGKPLIRFTFQYG